MNTQLLQEFFPRPAKRADGSYIYERVAPTIAATNAAIAAAERFAGSSAGGASSAPVSTAGSGAQAPQMLYKKRAYEEKSASSASNEQGIKNPCNFNYVFDTVYFFREKNSAIEYNDNCLLQALLISFKERMGDSMFQMWCHPKAE